MTSKKKFISPIREYQRPKHIKINTSEFSDDTDNIASLQIDNRSPEKKYKAPVEVQEKYFGNVL